MNKKGMNPQQMVITVLALLFLFFVLTSFGGKIKESGSAIKDTQDKFAIYKTQKSDFITKARMQNNQIVLSWTVDLNKNKYDSYRIFLTPESEYPSNEYYELDDDKCSGPLNERECSFSSSFYYSATTGQRPLFTSRYDVVVHAYSTTRKIGQSYTVVNYAKS